MMTFLLWILCIALFGTALTSKLDQDQCDRTKRDVIRGNVTVETFRDYLKVVGKRIRTYNKSLVNYTHYKQIPVEFKQMIKASDTSPLTEGFCFFLRQLKWIKIERTNLLYDTRLKRKKGIKHNKMINKTMKDLTCSLSAFKTLVDITNKDTCDLDLNKTNGTLNVSTVVATEFKLVNLLKRFVKCLSRAVKGEKDTKLEDGAVKKTQRCTSRVMKKNKSRKQGKKNKKPRKGKKSKRGRKNRKKKRTRKNKGKKNNSRKNKKKNEKRQRKKQKKNKKSDLE